MQCDAMRCCEMAWLVNGFILVASQHDKGSAVLIRLRKSFESLTEPFELRACGRKIRLARDDNVVLERFGCLKISSFSVEFLRIRNLCDTRHAVGLTHT